MNKDNFMKAMSMIDEDLIHEADTPYTAETSADKAEVLYNEKESETMVSGVDVYHRTAWKKFLGIAAALVISLGAVGGGAYYFSRLRNNNIEENVQYDSLYSWLKAEKDNYKMNIAACVNDSAVLGIPADNGQKEDFFEYMDQFDLKTEAEDITRTSRHLKFNFGTDEEIRFIFDLYENGDCSITEKGAENTTYHRIAEGKQVFDHFVKLYHIEDCDPPNWNDVSEEEIKAFIDECYDSSLKDSDYPTDTAFMYDDNSPNMDSKVYKIRNRTEINKTILSCEWEKADNFDFSTRYYLFDGMMLSESGYLMGVYDDCDAIYKIKDSVYLDKLCVIWLTYLERTDPKDINEAWQEIGNETTVQWSEGPLYVGQGGMDYDNINYYHHISDPVSFADEIMSLEWKECDRSEWESKVEYMSDTRGYVSDGYYMFSNIRNYIILSLSPRGYMDINDLGCYKLKNEADIEKLDQLLDEYLIMDESSVLSQKIFRGITDYDNLKAHFIFEMSYNGEEYQKCSGYLSVDAKNEKMYMTSEGTVRWGELKDVTSVVVMNGHDDSAFRVTDKETNEDLYYGLYQYCNGYASPPPNYHYIYFCKSIAEELSPRYLHDDSEYSFEEREVDGNTEITVHRESTEAAYYNYSYTLVLNEKGQLISYDSNGSDSHTSFKLDDYVFDSPDFTMEDISPVYDSIKAEQDALINNNAG